MVEISERLTRLIKRDFEPGTADEVLRALAQLPVEAVGGQDADRVLAAVVLSAHGQWQWFEDAMANHTSAIDDRGRPAALRG